MYASNTPTAMYNISYVHYGDTTTSYYATPAATVRIYANDYTSYRSQPETAQDLSEAIRTVKRRTGKDLSPLIAESFDRKKLLKILDELLQQEADRRELQETLHRRIRLSAPQPPRPVVRRARVCSASSCRTAMPAHAHCPR